MSAIKSFPRFLVDNGLIFEINRKVLHPLGLAMIVDVDSKGRGGTRKLAITALVETEDPEGWLYDKDGFEVGLQNFEAFLEKVGQERLEARKEKYGFIIQEDPSAAEE